MLYQLSYYRMEIDFFVDFRGKGTSFGAKMQISCHFFAHKPRFAYLCALKSEKSHDYCHCFAHYHRLYADSK